MLKPHKNTAWGFSTDPVCVPVRSQWVWFCCRSYWHTWCSQVWDPGGRCLSYGWNLLHPQSEACIWSPLSPSAQSPRLWSSQTAPLQRSWKTLAFRHIQTHSHTVCTVLLTSSEILTSLIRDIINLDKLNLSLYLAILWDFWPSGHPRKFRNRNGMMCLKWLRQNNFFF